jgi:uncharacterized repeat protein (TIGR01451 family)
MFDANELTLLVPGTPTPECECFIDPQLRIPETTLPTIAIGDFVSTELTAICGTSPYTWTLVSGTLPPGIILDTDGTLSGTPIVAGDFGFTMRVSDDVGDTDERAFLLAVSLVPSEQIGVRTYSTRLVSGREATQYVLVENLGPTLASNITVVSRVTDPSLATYLSADPAPEVFESCGIVWAIPSLAPGATQILTSVSAISAECSTTTCIFDINWTQQTPADLTQDVVDCLKSLFLSLPCASLCSTDCDALFGPECGNPTSVECFYAVLHCACCIVYECGLQVLQDIRDCGFELGARWICGHVPCAFDPNEKGVIANQFIRSDQLLVYPIHFENVGTVEAMDVFITDVLDPDLDVATLELLSPGGSFDSGTRTVRWDLFGINLQPGDGQTVLFSILPQQGLASGTEIRNSATIQFEQLTPFTTNEVINIIDDLAPEGVMAPLPPTSPRWIPLSWSGTDPVGEIDFYTIFVSVDGGGFTPFLTTQETSTLFIGEPNRTYGFLCLATDTAGNTEAQDTIAEVVTTTTTDDDTTPPVVSIDPVTTPTTDETQLITGAVSDPVVNGATSFLKSVSVNGQDVALINGAYSVVVALVEGPNAVSVVATDHAGNQSTETVEIVRVPPVGSVSGVVSVNSAGLENVTVDVVANEGAYIAFNTTDATGAYTFTDVPQGPTNVSVVVPLGYRALDPAGGIATIDVIGGETVTRDFTLEQALDAGPVRSVGYWTHQTNVYIKGNGNAHESQVDMETTYPMAMFNHFFENELNSIQVEDVTFIVSGADSIPLDLATIHTTLSVRGNAAMLKQAKRQYVALLLNVASEKLFTSTIVSEDGATCSQALQQVATYINDGDLSNDEIAKDICDTINNALLVASEVIDLNIQDIAFKTLPQVTEFLGAGPTPTPGATTVRFSLARPEHVSLRVYAVSGRLVREIDAGTQPAGRHILTWDGRDRHGHDVAAGVYFLRAKLGRQEHTQKLVVLR